jgi:CRP-like cAMP-binding protein
MSRIAPSEFLPASPLPEAHPPRTDAASDAELQSTILRQLRAAPFFSRISGATLKAVASRAEILRLSAGRVLFREGDAGNALYLLARGAAHVMEGDEQQVVNKLGSGAVFGEIATLAGARRSASIRTATEATLVCIPREALLQLMDANERVRKDVWKTFAERRFESLVRAVDRYKQLGLQGRRRWLQEGEHRELEPQQVLTVEPGTHLLVLSGEVELAHTGPQVAAQGALLLEAQHPLRVVSLERARVVLLPRCASKAGPVTHVPSWRSRSHARPC